MNKHAKHAAMNMLHNSETSRGDIMRDMMSKAEIDKRLAVADWPHNIVFKESAVIPTLTDVVPFDPFVEASALKGIVPLYLETEAVPPSSAFTFPNVPVMPIKTAVFDDSEWIDDPEYVPEVSPRQRFDAFHNRVAALIANVTYIKIDELEAKMAACKRALAISNKFTDADEKKKYRARAMSNMNKIRAQLAKATKNVPVR